MRRLAHTLPILLLVASGALAQGTISSGDLEFTFHSDLADPASLNADLRWQSIDQLGQLWFWYRCVGEDQETAFGAPDSQDYSDGQASLQWNSVCSDTVDIEISVVDCEFEETCSAGETSRSTRFSRVAWSRFSHTLILILPARRNTTSLRT